MFGLVGAFFGNANIISLFIGESGQFNPDFFKV